MLLIKICDTMKQNREIAMTYKFDRGTRNAAIIFGVVVIFLIVMYFVGDGKNVVN